MSAAQEEPRATEGRAPDVFKPGGWRPISQVSQAKNAAPRASVTR